MTGGHETGGHAAGGHETGGYAELIDRLAEARTGYHRDCAAIEEWYDRQCAAADDAVAARAADLASAENALDNAELAVRFTDAEATRLWAVLANRLGRPVVALGGVPEPDDSLDVGEHPGRLLDRVRELLDEVRPVRRRGAGRRLLAALALLGLMAAALAVAAALRHS